MPVCHPVARHFTDWAQRLVVSDKYVYVTLTLMQDFVSAALRQMMLGRDKSEHKEGAYNTGRK
jgi:hypothetical protein